MFDAFSKKMGALGARYSAAYGGLIGIIIGVLIEFVKLIEDQHRRFNDKFNMIEEALDALAAKVTGGKVSPSTPATPTLGSSFTVDVSSGATQYFGAYYGTTSAAAAGVPVGPIARSLRKLYVMLSAAMDSSTQVVVTAEYSTDLSTWTQIGTGSVTVTPSMGTGPFSADLSTVPVNVPPDAYVRWKAVFTGNPDSRNYGFYVG